MKKKLGQDKGSVVGLGVGPSSEEVAVWREESVWLLKVAVRRATLRGSLL